MGNTHQQTLKNTSPSLPVNLNESNMKLNPQKPKPDPLDIEATKVKKFPHPNPINTTNTLKNTGINMNMKKVENKQLSYQEIDNLVKSFQSHIILS